MRRGAAALRRRATIAGIVAAIPMVIVFALATLHHVGEERSALLRDLLAGIDTDRSRIEAEVRSVRDLADGAGHWIATGLEQDGPVPRARDLGNSFVRPVAGGNSLVEVIEPRAEGAQGVLMADPALADGPPEDQRIRSVAVSALDVMESLHRHRASDALGFSYFVGQRVDLLVVSPPLSTVRFLEAAGYTSVASLISTLRKRPYFRAITSQPAPPRTPRWAGPYRDLFTGDATMAYAVPVEIGGELQGVVGVNLLLPRLGRLLTPGGPYQHDVRVVSETGETLLLRAADGSIAAAGLGRDPAAPAGVTPADLVALPLDGDLPVALGDWRLLARPLEGTPWRLVWSVPSDAVEQSLARGASVFLLLMLAFLLSVGLGILLIRHFLVQPTLRFILFLDEVLSGGAPPVPEIADPWQLWATGVAAGFARNRELMRDATERGDHLAALIRISIDAVITFDGQGHILAFNPAAETMFGLSEKEAVGRLLEQVIVPREDIAGHRALMARLRRAGIGAMPREIVERQLRRADDGRVFPAEIAVTAVETGADLLLTAYVRDISTRVERERRIADLAFRDVRTGLPNRIGLLELVGAALLDGRPILLAFLDLVQLADIRLSFGHEFAEQVVCVFVARLAERLPEGVRIARVGPSHLAVLDTGSGASLIEGLEREETDPLVALGRTIALRCAIGATRVEAGRSSDAEAALREAETAALMARLGSHPARVVLFDPGMLAYLRRNAEIEQGLRQALARPDELWIAFQPLIALEDGRLHAFEVLVRWNHPDFGPVSPVEFIPVAERTGLIFPLGGWIVGAAIDVLADWVARCGGSANAPGLAINLSARQLSDPELEATINRRLAATGLDPALIELEITETILLERSTAVLEVLTRLRALGMRIAVDDFGTGYSSLGYLRTLPVDVVKIDRSFIASIATDSASQAIVRAVTALGHDLGLKIVAEGIETPEEARTVRRIGCDFGQGFLFSRPVPADDALDMVLSRRSWGSETRPGADRS